MTDEKTPKLDRKRLERLFGKRETNRILADAMCWERMTQRGETPRFTPRPVRL